MNAFHFGSTAEPLLGLLDEPVGGGSRTRGVVLCQPWGAEYIRAHRACRRLATMIAAGGLQTLRFDYFGTGDSAGDDTAASLARATDDARAAMDEIRDTAGVARVSLVGLRVGAAVALRAAATRRDVDRIVLWDPVLDGARWLAEVSPGAPAEGVADLQGFAASATCRAEIAAVTPEALASAVKVPVTIVAIAPDRAHEAFLAAVQAAGGVASYELVTDPPVWIEEADFGTGALPTTLLQRIVAHLT